MRPAIRALRARAKPWHPLRRLRSSWDDAGISPAKAPGGSCILRRAGDGSLRATPPRQMRCMMRAYLSRSSFLAMTATAALALIACGGGGTPE